MDNKTENKSGKRIAIVGGGQLAKMTALSALQLGCDVLVLERKSEGPAVNLASHSFVGDWDNPDDLINLAEHADIVTLENEFVDANSLSKLENAGHTLFPTAKSISLVQDKFIQKQTLQEAGLPLSPFRAIESREDIIEVAKEFNWPLVIKARRNGYDGKGNATVNNESEIDAAWDKLDGDNRPKRVSWDEHQRHADIVRDHRRSRLVCVCEDHRQAGEPRNFVAAITDDGNRYAFFIAKFICQGCARCMQALGCDGHAPGQIMLRS